MPDSFSLTGRYVDILRKEIYPAEIRISNGKILAVAPFNSEKELSLPYILPGFIDSHVHIESSMLIPSEFARLAVVHGTVATVSDPHEIANVCGLEGINFMIENGRKVPFKFNFGAPSCVPATVFETSGARIDSEDIRFLLEKKEIKYLSEMMNFPGVLAGDPEVLKKIDTAKLLHKPVDGHAPGLRGEDARKYIAAGISTDHECFTRAEATEKLKYGMKILIREGSAAKNFDALIGLLDEYPEEIMFCSDDKHPDSLVNGHINQLCTRAIAGGQDIFKVLRAACINPVLHYQLDSGILRVGDDADFIVTADLREFKVLETYIGGRLVAKNGKTLIESVPADPVNQFNGREISLEDLRIRQTTEAEIPVIEALDGQLITQRLSVKMAPSNGELKGDPSNDILKILVVNRYNPAPVAKAFIKNFGLKNGAIASSVAHDSHNIIAVGDGDENLVTAINGILKAKGGISCVSGKTLKVLPLPVAGLMSTEDGFHIAREYTALDQFAKNLGTRLSAPFMTLSFMALLVIPHLKLSDKGLFDGDHFRFV